MIQEIKILLGDSRDSFSDELIELTAKQAITYVEGYCNRTLDYELEIIATRIAVIMLNRIGSEGLASTSYSGVSETYLNDWPEDIKSVLKRKRKLKVI